MDKEKRLGIGLLLLVISSLSVFAQETNLYEYEDQLRTQFKELTTVKTDSSERVINNQVIKMVNQTSVFTDSMRMIVNSKIISLFDEVLNKKESLDYPFEKLKNISKLSSPDGQVRVIGWNIPKDNGEYIYYCYIQYLNKKTGEFNLFKLNDASEAIENPEFERTDEDSWYGALYYYLREDNSGKNTYYTLFGWDGNNNFSTKKMIECFYIKDNKLVLGPPVFKMENATKNRLVFEFSKQAKMMLRYDNKINTIVFDHLAPLENKFEGQYMYYGPDLSQDGIQFIDGNWVLKPNLDLRNMEESTGKSIKKSH